VARHPETPDVVEEIESGAERLAEIRLEPPHVRVPARPGTAFARFRVAARRRHSAHGILGLAHAPTLFMHSLRNRDLHFRRL